MSGEISLVAEGLTEIADGELVNLGKNLAVTSNDEIGDLVVAFNKIQALQKENRRVIDEKNEELTAINQELIAANEQLNDYADTSAELAIAKERNRFAHEIHDTLGHTLTMLLKMLEVSAITCKSDVIKTEVDLQKAVEIAREGLKGVRRSVSGLSIVNLDQKSLGTALEELVAAFKENSSIDVHFSAEGIDMKFNSLYTNTIYRICQEAMTNALRHGKATRMVIIIRVKDDFIKLSIIDDGIGCKEIIKGFGLSGMEQRVKEIKGSLDFSSSDEGGFNIYVEIPINPI
jgi:signal transduction histidine kinase